MKTSNRLSKPSILTLLALIMLLFVACSPGGEPAADTDDTATEMEHEDDEEMDDHDAEHEGGAHDDEHDDSEPHARIPNENGAAVRIISPTEGDTFAHGDQIIVEVETENFDISQEGYHWHVYVDGTSWGMVMGGNTDQPLTGVEPGEHEIAVYLSIPTHEEYEDGDSVRVTVEE